MKLKGIIATLSISASMAIHAQAADEQWANAVLGYSSQYSTTSWSANQALGSSNTFSYGDIASAWAPLAKNGTLEYLTLGFATPVQSIGAVVRETYGNGFVYQIDALDSQNNLHTVWTGNDMSQAGSPVDASFSWGKTSFQTVGLKLYVNTDHNVGAWEEIDSVKLLGTVAAVPEPETYAMLLAGLGVIVAAGKRRKEKQA